MKKILTVFLLLLPFGNAFEAAKLERQERRIEEIEIIIEERPKLPLVHRGKKIPQKIKAIFKVKFFFFYRISSSIVAQLHWTRTTRSPRSAL